MAGLTDATRNGMLANSFLSGSPAGTKAAFLSLHTADPGLTGTSEAAVTRQAIPWPASATAGVSDAGTVNLTGVPAGTYGFAGYWTAASGGTFVGSRALNGTVTYGSGGNTLPVAVKETQN